MNIRTDWQLDEVIDLFNLPFNDLVFKAQTIHRENHDPNAVQISTLMSIKTGGCAEDCKYCPQSASYDTPVKATKLSALEEVRQEAAKAKAAGATRFCMGAAWRSPKDKDLDNVIEMVKAVNDLGMESCATLGMLKPEQAQKLADAGLDYYNHNIDTSPEYYGNIITTRTFEDRLNTLENVRQAGMKTCCGGIVGMGEAVKDRASMLLTLANMPEHPHSVPINLLVKVEGTPFSPLPEGGAGGGLSYPKRPGNPLLVERAKENRKTNYEPEKRLWKSIKSRQLENYKFRRQEAIGNYIADFICYEKNLIIEIDGDSHANSQEYDQNRTEYFNSIGFKVIRFRNIDVMKNFEGVLTEISNELTKTNPPPSPPSGRGVEPLDFVRTIAVARILMPKSAVRLSAGREGMTDELQALCFLAGANSIFYGEKLLTTPNPEAHEDRKLFEKLGIKAA